MPVLQHGWAAIAPEINLSEKQRESIPWAEVVNGSVKQNAALRAVHIIATEDLSKGDSAIIHTRVSLL
jgi:hypothetical protein